ncbi:MAG: rhomboid family intramembrane serine protease [Opitutales bacterium]
MLSDRAYMRTDYPARGTNVLTWMVCALIAAFILQVVTSRFHLYPLEDALVLTPDGLRHGHVWTLLTYVMMHGSFLHLLFNGLGLFLIGRELIGPLGSARFLGLIFVSSTLGGLVWFACHFNQAGLGLLGASGVVSSLFIVFACIYPEREVTFLLFFVLPVTLRPKLLAWILLSIDSAGFLLSELPGGRFDTGIAFSAHLGGMLAGWLFYRFFYASNGLDRAPTLSLPAWMKRRSKKGDSPTLAQRIDLNRSGNLRSEVDRILDKINSHGFGALSEQEKRVLDEAKDLLSRH